MRSEIKSGKTVFHMQKGSDGIDQYLGPGDWSEKWFVIATLPNGRRSVHLILDTENETDAAMDRIRADVE